MGNLVSTDKEGNPRSTFAKLIDPVGLCFQPSAIESSALPQPGDEPSAADDAPAAADGSAEITPAAPGAGAADGAPETGAADGAQPETGTISAGSGVAGAPASSSSVSDEVSGGGGVRAKDAGLSEDVVSAARVGGVDAGDEVGKVGEEISGDWEQTSAAVVAEGAGPDSGNTCGVVAAS